MANVSPLPFQTLPAIMADDSSHEDSADAGLNSSGSSGQGMAFAIADDGELGLNDPCSPIPQSLKRRLTGESDKQISKEEIESKLKAAEQKRAAFLEWLSEKARPKQRSAPPTSPAEELAQRLEAKLLAAEAKRQELRAQDLARLAERHEAVEAALRSAKEAPAREDTITEKMRRAEEKRAALLEAERARASERVMQARQVAAAVLASRERDSAERQERLEAKLERAAKRRESFLSLRGTSSSGAQKRAQGDRLSRSLGRCWREFRKTGKTTAQLASAFKQCGLSRTTAAGMPFEQFAEMITAPRTLKEVKALLARLERRLLISTGQSNAADCERLLRRLQTSSAVGRSPASSPGSSRQASPATRRKPTLQQQTPLERYPARVFLCAYMLLAHPDAVFNVKGRRESSLVEAAEKMLPQFEALLDNILTPVAADKARQPFAKQLAAFDSAWLHYLDQFVAWKVQDAAALVDDLVRMAVQLEASMLQKTGAMHGERESLSHDHSAIHAHVAVDQGLLRERIAQLAGEQGLAQLDASLKNLRNNFLEERRLGPSSPTSMDTSPVATPPGSPPLTRRSSFSPAGSPLGGGSRSLGASPPATRRSSFAFKFPPARPKQQHQSNQPQTTVAGFTPRAPQSPAMKPARLVIPDDPRSPTTTQSAPPSLLPSPVLPPPTQSNVGMVHELLYNPNWQLPQPHSEPDPDDSAADPVTRVQARVKATMEAAFWSGVEEGLRSTPRDWKRIVSLVAEVREELLSIAPAKWRDDIGERMDTELLQQVLEVNEDVAQLRGLLDYAAELILNLGAPVRDVEQKALHQSLLAELAAGTHDLPTTVTKGLRFLFDRLKVLKRDLSNVQLRQLAPLVTRAGVGLDYERAWFVAQLGLADLPPGTSLAQKLPRTVTWLAAAKAEAERVQPEVDALLEQAAAALPAGASSVVLPAMRTGTSRTSALPSSPPQAPSAAPATAGPVKVDWGSLETRVKVGLLQTVQDTTGATEASIPETLALDVGRLRACQNAYQRLLVLSTGLLLARQALAGKAFGVTDDQPGRTQAIQSAIAELRRQLAQLLEQPGVNVAGIGQLLGRGVAEFAGEEAVPAEIETMTRLIAKATTPGDPLFVLVGKAVLGALCGALLAPAKSAIGAEAVQIALRRAGAALLADDALRAAEELRKVADLNIRVHGGLYLEISL